MLWSGGQAGRQRPTRQDAPGGQETPQAPQLAGSFWISAQVAPHWRRLDGQKISFVGDGVGEGVSGTVVAGVAGAGIRVVRPGEGVAAGMTSVTPAVSSGAGAGAGEESRALIPGIRKKKSAARIRSMTMTIPARIFTGIAGPGDTGEGGAAAPVPPPSPGPRGVPQAVQNFVESSLDWEHRGQIRVNQITTQGNFPSFILYTPLAAVAGTGRGKNRGGNDYFAIYQPVWVSSRIALSVFFVSRLTTIMARSEITNAYAEK